MPFVRIDLFEGRTLEQKKALAKEVTEAVVRNTGALSQLFTLSLMICLKEPTSLKVKCAPNNGSTKKTFLACDIT